MAYTGEYKCSNCGKVEKPEMLVAKKVMFQEIGLRPQTFRSRIAAWLCPRCVAADEDWNRPAYASPGLKPVESAQN